MCLIGGLKTQKMLASTKIRQGRASSYIRTILHGELLFLYLLQNRENFTIQVIRLSASFFSTSVFFRISLTSSSNRCNFSILP